MSIDVAARDAWFAMLLAESLERQQAGIMQGFTARECVDRTNTVLRVAPLTIQMDPTLSIRILEAWKDS